MVRLILSGIEEITCQRMATIQFANSQFRFCFSSSSQYGGLQLKLAAPAQDKEHRTGSPCQRGNWVHSNRTEEPGLMLHLPVT